MERVLQGAAAVITVTFAVGSVATDPTPDSATIELLRSDGTIIQAAGTAALNTGTGTFAYELDPLTHSNLLDEVSARWTVQIGGQPQTITTRVQVVGGFLFALTDARARPPLDDVGSWPEARLASWRNSVEDDLERACRGLAFVPRFALETHVAPRGRRLYLHHPRIRAVRFVTVDGTAWTQAQRDALDIGNSWVDNIAGPWRTRHGSPRVTIGYEHGLDYAPADVSDAALTLAAGAAVGSGAIDPRATRIDTQDGSLYLASAPDDRFGIPAVDRVVRDYRRTLVR